MSFYGYNPANFKTDLGFMGDAIEGLGKFGELAYDAHEVKQQLDNDSEKVTEYKQGREQLFDLTSKDKKIQQAYMNSKGGVDAVLAIGEQHGYTKKNEDGTWGYTDDDQYVDNSGYPSTQKSEEPNQLASAIASSGVSYEEGLDLIDKQTNEITSDPRDKSVKEIRSLFTTDAEGKQTLDNALLQKIIHKEMMATIPQEIYKGTDKNKIAVRTQSSYADETAFNVGMFMKPLGEVDSGVYGQMQNLMAVGSADGEAMKMYQDGVSEYKTEREYNAFSDKIEKNEFSSEADGVIPFSESKEGEVKESPKYEIPDVPWTRMEYVNSNGLTKNPKAMEKNKIEDAKYNTKIGGVFNDMLTDMNSVAIDSAYADLSQADQNMGEDFWNAENVSRMVSLVRNYDPVAELEKKGMGEHLEYMRQTDPTGYSSFIKRTKEKRTEMVDAWRTALKGKSSTVRGGGGGGATPKMLSYYYEKMKSNQGGITASHRGNLSSINAKLKDKERDKKLDGGLLQQQAILKNKVAYSESLGNAYAKGATNAFQLESGKIDTSTTGVSDKDVTTFQLDAVSETLKGMEKSFDGNIKNSKNNDELIKSVMTSSKGAPVLVEKRSIGKGKSARETFKVYHDANDNKKWDEGERVLGEPGKGAYEAKEKAEKTKQAKLKKDKKIDEVFTTTVTDFFDDPNNQNISKKDFRDQSLSETVWVEKLIPFIKEKNPTAPDDQIKKLAEMLTVELKTNNTYWKTKKKVKKGKVRSNIAFNKGLNVSGSNKESSQIRYRSRQKKY
jgi:hypothetical protein